MKLKWLRQGEQLIRYWKKSNCPILHEMSNSVLEQLSQVPMVESIGCVYQVIPSHVPYVQSDAPNNTCEPHLSGTSLEKGVPAPERWILT